MFQEERHAKILEIVANEGKISTSRIQREFQVGYGTAKKDLDTLAEKGLIQRTHGGGLLLENIGFMPSGVHNMSPKDRCSNVTPDYLSIAKEAVGMIEPDDVVYITHASLGYLMAQELSVSCTVVTNSLTIAEELRAKKNIRTVVTGGEMNENGSFYDEFTMSVIRRMRFDKAFITAAACTADFGLSIQTSRSIGLTNLICKNSRQVIAMIPAVKLGKDSVLQLMPIEDADILITDPDAADDECAAIAERGVKIVISDMPREDTAE